MEKASFIAVSRADPSPTSRDATRPASDRRMRQGHPQATWKSFAWRGLRPTSHPETAGERIVSAGRFSFTGVQGVAISDHNDHTGGNSQVRRISARVGWSLLLGAGLAGAEPRDRQGLFSPQSTGVHLSEVKGSRDADYGHTYSLGLLRSKRWQ